VADRFRGLTIAPHCVKFGRPTDIGRTTDIPTRRCGRKGLTMTYEIEGKLLEVCSCNVLCPCWIGEDPDRGTCDSALAWHVDADLIPYKGATGNPTILSETVFSTIPGSPVYAAKTEHFTRDGGPYGLPNVDVTGRNALQGHFRFAA